MPYLNLDINFFNHIKTKRLIGLLGRGAAELPLRIWAHCGANVAKAGNLAGYSAKEIESIAGWWGPEGEMVAAMLKIGFLDKAEDGYQVHDWNEHEGHLISFHLRAKEAARKRWGDAVSNASSIAKSPDKQCPNQPYQPAVPTIPTNQERLRGSNNRPTPQPHSIFGPDDLASLWNQTAHKAYARVQLLTSKRLSHIKACLEAFPDKSFWEGVISQMNASPFLRGERGSRDWKASFDWMLNKNNLVKILEGNYRDAKTNQPAGIS